MFRNGEPWLLRRLLGVEQFYRRCRRPPVSRPVPSSRDDGATTPPTSQACCRPSRRQSSRSGKRRPGRHDQREHSSARSTASAAGVDGRSPPQRPALITVALCHSSPREDFSPRASSSLAIPSSVVNTRRLNTPHHWLNVSRHCLGCTWLEPEPWRGTSARFVRLPSNHPAYLCRLHCRLCTGRNGTGFFAAIAAKMCISSGHAFGRSQAKKGTPLSIRPLIKETFRLKRSRRALIDIALRCGRKRAPRKSGRSERLPLHPHPPAARGVARERKVRAPLVSPGGLANAHKPPPCG